ncbi:unnamed protein product [Paramecium sonneborni]|uniref:Transmembrane protein n=1 Tax=Paramecium sonneborni TaxID=65129 RepID=A0A8S1N5H4_9CILI|nr:unnamed protein product [Paramecium sonneborni]CAD8087282.1 unnamed protein product [Paramecium sonneborni]
MIDHPKISLVFSSNNIIAVINIKQSVIKISLHNINKFIILILNGNFVASKVTVIIYVITKMVIHIFCQLFNKIIQLVNTNFFVSQNRLKFLLKKAFVYNPFNQPNTQEQFNKKLSLIQILQIFKKIKCQDCITK